MPMAPKSKAADRIDSRAKQLIDLSNDGMRVQVGLR